MNKGIPGDDPGDGVALPTEINGRSRLDGSMAMPISEAEARRGRHASLSLLLGRWQASVTAAVCAAMFVDATGLLRMSPAFVVDMVCFPSWLVVPLGIWLSCSTINLGRSSDDELLTKEGQLSLLLNLLPLGILPIAGILTFTLDMHGR